MFVYGVRECSNFILLHVAVQLDNMVLFFFLSGEWENEREWGLGDEQGTKKEIDIREGYLISASSGLVSRRKNFSSRRLSSCNGGLQIKLIKGR